MACKVADLKDFIYKQVELADKSPKNAEFNMVNPTGHFPFIEERDYRVLGGNHVVYIFLCKNNSAIGSMLLPAADEQKIKGIIGWEQAKMAMPTQQIFKMQYQTHVFSQKPTKANFESW